MPARRGMQHPTSPIGVSVRSVRPVLERLRALGLDVAAVVAASGSDAAELDDETARIPHALALALWREAVRASRDESFGLHAAEQIRPGAFDVLEYAIRSSATLGDGLERLVRHHRVLHDAAVVRLEVDGERAVLSHALPAPAVALPRHPAEFIVAAWLVTARQATGTELVPVEVRFRHARPEDLAEHERLFRAPLRFDAETNGLVLARAELERPLVKADPGLCAVLERHVRELLDGIPRAGQISDRVRPLLAQELASGVPALGAVARRLHMSPRTLQRELQRDGTTLRELADGLRRELALRYLAEQRLAISEVAFLLGFSEVSAFHRAFKRWSGRTPAEFRRSH